MAKHKMTKQFHNLSTQVLAKNTNCVQNILSAFRTQCVDPAIYIKNNNTYCF